MKTKNICKFVAPSAVEGLSISCFIYETSHEVMRKPYTLPHHRAVLFIKGGGECRIDERALSFAVGTIAFLRPGETVSVEPRETTEYMYIDFSGARGESLLKRFGIHAYACLFDGFDGLIPLWRESLAHASEGNVDLAAESILLYTFSRFSVPEAAGDTLLQRIVEFSEEHFADSELSLSAIAEELGYNAKYISHLFKQKMGIGYSEYLRTLRIKYAVSLLEHGLDSVKNIAFLSGFRDPLYFSAVFKESLGVSPKEYRARPSAAHTDREKG